MTTNTVNPIPDGYHSLTPFIAVADGPKAIDFYTSVFGAEVISRQDLPDGRVAHAELKFGNSLLQLSDEMPQIGLRAPTGEWVHSSLVHYVPDVDKTYAKAIEAGATSVEAVQTFLTGDRFGTVIDPFGHRWAIMTRVDDVSREEAERRINEWLASGAAGVE
ncbi:VOC family protein [Kribbella jejuensis]|uniref:Putative glyoxalase superfamily protein PhnB n=1 Tax=Kribbella jejuensis TaxID=236068 RepID=A0A542ETR0_9ACTN|nr:VOC family protein [Kribbella jejuensis]TQJ18564.1 putative glyoxalase superfamily protein PhnB [Kribbella jejuensis]